MAKQNLLSRLGKDLRRSPKKTVVLLLLAVVAVWFWAPLVWKWIAPAGDGAAETAEAAASVPTTTLTSANSTNAETIPPAPSFNWRNLSNLFEYRQLMAAEELAGELKDPFFKAPKTNTETEDDDAQPAVAETASLIATLTPQQLGMAVTSTLSGGGASWARINGRLCHVGTVLVVPDGNQTHEFEIVKIQPGSVTLLGSDATYELQQADKKTSMQLTRADDARSVNEYSDANRVMIDSARRDD